MPRLTVLVTLVNEGTSVAYTTTIGVTNSMTATFSVSGGFLIVGGMPAGNNAVAVYQLTR